MRFSSSDWKSRTPLSRSRKRFFSSCKESERTLRVLKIGKGDSEFQTAIYKRKAQKVVSWTNLVLGPERICHLDASHGVIRLQYSHNFWVVLKYHFTAPPSNTQPITTL